MGWLSECALLSGSHPILEWSSDRMEAGNPATCVLLDRVRGNRGNDGLETGLWGATAARIALRLHLLRSHPGTNSTIASFYELPPACTRQHISWGDYCTCLWKRTSTGTKIGDVRFALFLVEVILI